jgi:hypothetical protein
MDTLLREPDESVEKARKGANGDSADVAFSPEETEVPA